jgi:hypothetical protein
MRGRGCFQRCYVHLACSESLCDRLAAILVPLEGMLDAVAIPTAAAGR